MVQSHPSINYTRSNKGGKKKKKIPPRNGYGVLYIYYERKTVKVRDDG